MNSQNQDHEHLRLLTIFHYVLGGITALCACFPLIHFAIGLVMVLSPDRSSGSQNAPGAEQAVGLLFIVFAAAFILLGWALAAANLYAGRCLARREKHTFCIVVAAVNCLNAPIGTILGVFTIIVLMRPSVKQMFDANRFDQQSPGAAPPYNENYRE